MAIKGMELAWIAVSDIKKAKKFFTETLGLKVSQDDGEYGWVELKGENGALIGLAQEGEHSPVNPGQNAVLTLTVTQIEKVKANLVKQGVKMIGDIQEIPGHVKMQLFEDMDGNKFQLAEILN